MLFDLGANINLMMLLVFKKLRLREAKPTIVSLLLDDSLVEQPKELVEEALVKVDKFIFSANFIIFDMDDN